MSHIKFRYFFLGVILTGSISSIIASAGSEDGIFGDYFTRIITNSCTQGSVVTGFDTSNTNYGKTKCSTVQSILGSVFTSGPSNPGQAMIGFNPDGTPKYDDVTYWKKSGQNIFYTGSSVGIGTNTPTSILSIENGAISGRYILKPSYVDWLTYGVGDGGAAIYNDANAHKKLVIVGNNSAGGVREVGIWDNLTVAYKITTPEICIGGVCKTEWPTSMVEDVCDTEGKIRISDGKIQRCFLSTNYVNSITGGWYSNPNSCPSEPTCTTGDTVINRTNCVQTDRRNNWGDIQYKKTSSVTCQSPDRWKTWTIPAANFQ